MGGAILAAMNTASEYGFRRGYRRPAGVSLCAVKALAAIPNPLLNEAIGVTVLAGITSSASGGMSIALAAMSETFVAAAHAANIPLRGPAPRRRHGQRRRGHPAAQRGGDHPAGDPLA